MKYDRQKRDWDIKFYWVKTGKDGKCPLCGSPLGGCEVGEFCPSDKCPYVDGGAFLNSAQAEEFRKKGMLIEYL